MWNTASQLSSRKNASLTWCLQTWQTTHLMVCERMRANDSFNGRLPSLWLTNQFWIDHSLPIMRVVGGGFVTVKHVVVPDWDTTIAILRLLIQTEVCNIHFEVSVVCNFQSVLPVWASLSLDFNFQHLFRKHCRKNIVGKRKHAVIWWVHFLAKLANWSDDLLILDNRSDLFSLAWAQCNHLFCCHMQQESQFTAWLDLCWNFWHWSSNISIFLSSCNAGFKKWSRMFFWKQVSDLSLCSWKNLMHFVVLMTCNIWLFVRLLWKWISGHAPTHFLKKGNHDSLAKFDHRANHCFPHLMWMWVFAFVWLFFQFATWQNGLCQTWCVQTSHECVDRISNQARWKDGSSIPNAQIHSIFSTTMSTQHCEQENQLSCVLNCQCHNSFPPKPCWGAPWCCFWSLSFKNLDPTCGTMLTNTVLLHSLDGYNLWWGTMQVDQWKSVRGSSSGQMKTQLSIFTRRCKKEWSKKKKLLQHSGQTSVTLTCRHVFSLKE